MRRLFRTLRCSLLAVLIVVSLSISNTLAVRSPGEGIKTVVIDDYTLDEKQENSIAMLNYLTSLTEEINSSSNSKLYLEEAYSSLINNTNPQSVDERTQDYLREILNNIERFRMTDVKRERLEYIYEQNKAQAIRSAMPNPLGLLSVVQSGDLKKLIVSAVYMAVDSAVSYQSAKSEAEMKYLQDGWALDDEQAKTLHENRSEGFLYMLDIVRENNLPGNLTLNEASVQEFVKWKNNENIKSRIQYLESHKETYEAFGNYWLLLAKSYYDCNDYQKCLDALLKYEGLKVKIFRKDHELAKVIPCAIDSLEKLYDAKKMNSTDYYSQLSSYLSLLEKNTSDDEWALRYFLAQAYIKLYSRSKTKRYLIKAYNIAVDNVNYLVADQKAKNAAYLTNIVKKEVPKGST